MLVECGTRGAVAPAPRCRIRGVWWASPTRLDQDRDLGVEGAALDRVDPDDLAHRLHPWTICQERTPRSGVEFDDRAAQDPVAVVGARVEADRARRAWWRPAIRGRGRAARARAGGVRSRSRTARRADADPISDPLGVDDRAQLGVELGRLVEMRVERRAVDVEDGPARDPRAAPASASSSSAIPVLLAELARRVPRGRRRGAEREHLPAARQLDRSRPRRRGRSRSCARTSAKPGVVVVAEHHERRDCRRRSAAPRPAPPTARRLSRSTRVERRRDGGRISASCALLLGRDEHVVAPHHPDLLAQLLQRLLGAIGTTSPWISARATSDSRSDDRHDHLAGDVAAEDQHVGVGRPRPRSAICESTAPSRERRWRRTAGCARPSARLRPNGPTSGGSSWKASPRSTPRRRLISFETDRSGSR